MSTVTLSIGPKTYTVACADGEEPHITMLGEMIAEKYALLGSSRAPLEAQNLLFSALFLADELAEARKRGASETTPEPETAHSPAGEPSADLEELEALRTTIARLEDDLAAARKASERSTPALAAIPQSDLFASPNLADALAERLEALAADVEASAVALEAAAASA